MANNDKQNAHALTSSSHVFGGGFMPPAEGKLSLNNCIAHSMNCPTLHTHTRLTALFPGLPG